MHDRGRLTVSLVRRLRLKAVNLLQWISAGFGDSRRCFCAAQERKSPVFEALHDQIVSRIRDSAPDASAIYAYGSRVKGRTHPESDLDIALLLPPGAAVSMVILAQLEGDLEAIVGCAVEVSVLNREASVIHCKEVISTGVLLYIGNPLAVEAFEMQVLAEYADFCEDRIPVFQAYSQESTSG